MDMLKEFGSHMLSDRSMDVLENLREQAAAWLKSKYRIEEYDLTFFVSAPRIPKELLVTNALLAPLAEFYLRFDFEWRGEAYYLRTGIPLKLHKKALDACFEEAAKAKATFHGTKITQVGATKL